MPLIPEHFPGEKLLMKIWETLTEKGVGGLISPWQIRREGKARAEVRHYELLMEEQARQEIEQIRAGRKVLDGRGRLVDAAPALPSPSRSEDDRREPLLAIPKVTDPTSLLRYATQQSTLREAVRALNLHRIALYAEQEAESTPDAAVSEEPIDPDWFARWRRNAEDATSETLQRIWARVLAGEARQPKSYSFLTLEFLRNVSVDDAHLIEKLAPFVIEGDIIRDVGTYLDEAGVNYDKLLVLQELGIVAGVEALELRRTFASRSPDKFLAVLVAHNKVLAATSDDPNAKLQLPIFPLTRVGKEVMSLGSFEPNEPYLKAVGELIKSRGFRVLLGDRVSTPEGPRMENAIEL